MLILGISKPNFKTQRALWCLYNIDKNLIYAADEEPVNLTMQKLHLENQGKISKISGSN